MAQKMKKNDLLNKLKDYELNFISNVSKDEVNEENKEILQQVFEESKNFRNIFFNNYISSISDDLDRRSDKNFYQYIYFFRNYPEKFDFHTYSKKLKIKEKIIIDNNNYCKKKNSKSLFTNNNYEELNEKVMENNNENKYRLNRKYNSSDIQNKNNNYLQNKENNELINFQNKATIEEKEGNEQIEDIQISENENEQLNEKIELNKSIDSQNGIFFGKKNDINEKEPNLNSEENIKYFIDDKNMQNKINPEENNIKENKNLTDKFIIKKSVEQKIINNKNEENKKEIYYPSSYIIGEAESYFNTNKRIRFHKTIK